MNPFAMAVISASKSYRDLGEDITIHGERVRVARRIRPIEKAIMCQAAMSDSLVGIDLNCIVKDGAKKNNPNAINALDCLIKESYSLSIREIAERIPAEYSLVFKKVKWMQKNGILSENFQVHLNMLSIKDEAKNERDRKDKALRSEEYDRRFAAGGNCAEKKKGPRKGGRPAIRFSSICEREDFSYLCFSYKRL